MEPATDSAIPRLVYPTEASDLITQDTMILTMPRPLNQVDAMCVFPGQGEYQRIRDVVVAYDRHPTARRLLIAGHNRKERTWQELTVEVLSQEPFNLERRDGVLIQVHADHTPAQAEWVLEQIRREKLKSLALFVSPYHLARAYSTLVKSLIKQGSPERWIPIVAVPVGIAPNWPVPETGLTSWELCAGEVSRMIKYQEQGDVATLPELCQYLSWLWEGPIMKDYR